MHKNCYRKRCRVINSLTPADCQVDLASSLLALARLSFAQLVDAGKLFSRSAMVQSPQCAAAVLEVVVFKGEADICWGLES